MDKKTQAVKNRANKMFADMSKDMVDAGEESSYPDSPMSVSEPRKWYPTITVPRNDYECLPGDTVNILQTGVVKNVSEKSITVEIKKAMVMEAPEEQEEEGESADEEEGEDDNE